MVKFQVRRWPTFLLGKPLKSQHIHDYKPTYLSLELALYEEVQSSSSHQDPGLTQRLLYLIRGQSSL